MQVQSNGLHLEYETFGRPSDPALVLIMGLGNQLVDWPEAFCEALASAGYYVVRFDNRDVGRSSKLEQAPRPNIPAAWLRQKLGLRQHNAYTLDDMADDTVGLMDGLGLINAHLIGISMGGMIAQLIAARHPKRVRALTLMMTHSGTRRVRGATLAVQRQLIRRPKHANREGLLRHSVKTWQMIGSPGYPQTEHQRYGKARRGFDRSFYPPGVLRQMHAILAAADRSPLLAAIVAPTLVLHGEADPLVPVAAGRDLARSIPNARLLTIPGWGHDLPPQLLPRLTEAILNLEGHPAPSRKDSQFGGASVSSTLIAAPH